MFKVITILFIQIFLISSCTSNQVVSFNNEELFRISNKKNNILLKVIDFDSSEPLVGANIIITNNKLDTYTDIDGIAYIPKENNENIKISYIGYKAINFIVEEQTIDNILIKMKADEFTGNFEYAFSQDQNDARRDISNGIIQIYKDINDSTKNIAKNLASKYGFKFNYPDEIIMILNVEEYNNTVIKFLEKRNGTNWYERFNTELDARIKEDYKK
jgi:hypothetical protein